VTAGWAIVGPGMFAANRIAPALNKAVNGRLVAVVSRDRLRAEEFAAEHGAARAYDDLDVALRDREIDCVWIATPHSLHLEPVLASARAGKHVLCEKPLATDRASAREMLRACARANVRLGTGFHLRHHPLHKEARRLVLAGDFGEQIFDAAAEWSVPPPKPGAGYNAAWRQQADLAYAGITTGTGVHAIDLLRFVLDDEIVAISAYTDADSSPIAPLETRAEALLRFSRGTFAVVRCLRGVAGPRNDLSLAGPRGWLTTRATLGETTRGTVESFGVDPEVAGTPVGWDMYAAQAEAFVHAVERGEEPSASGEDGLRAVEALAALLESARTGRTVQLG
jgi:1,5-anhydro-D-fructose reductase (1,5-anhydro-D-mannitol-forming)